MTAYRYPEMTEQRPRCVVLIAGHPHQVLDYCHVKRLNPHDFLTPFSRVELMGLRPDEVRLIGTHWDNPAASEAWLRWEHLITYDNY